MSQEGRGIGLVNKLKAYHLQEMGLDTVDANLKLGFKADERDYGIGAQILRDQHVSKMRLITNNPVKRTGLEGYGLEVTEIVPIVVEPNKYNERYLKTKQDRMGHELQAAVDPTPWLTIEGNAALSKNKIKDFDEVVEDWDNGTQTIHYDNSTLAFSPSTILNGFVRLHHKGWQAVWHTNFVSHQYLDNTENCDRSLPSYSTSNLSLSYTLKPKKVMKEAIFGLHLNNVFNRRYAASGWVYSAIAESYGHTNDNRYYLLGFVPMSGFTIQGSVTLRF
jgi:iron complex outermembrane receptor protein